MITPSLWISCFLFFIVVADIGLERLSSSEPVFVNRVAVCAFILMIL